MSANWPQPLKDWVQACLAKMTEANKEEASKELREIIRKCHEDGTIWTRDWASMKLQTFEPKHFKRKLYETTSAPISQTKKAKKSALGSGNHNSTLPAQSHDRMAARAARFSREHEIERQKQAGLLPDHEYSRHVNHRSAMDMDMDYTMDYNGGVHGLTTQPSSFSSNNGWKGKGRGGGASGHLARRKYLNTHAGDEDSSDFGGLNWDRFTIVGTSDQTFKSYLRLTSEPDPRTIRPYNILQRTLVEVSRKWKAESNYEWVRDQFKSLRQDLTVQRIKNEFTVQVYEMHARIALEESDLVEYNQCQSALRQLYELGLPGKREEFMAYRILYLLHVRNKSDLNRLMSTLTTQMKEHPAVKHALDVQRAMSTSNYHAFFILFANAPNMGAYIMDHFIERVKLEALCIMSKAYKTLPLRFITDELGFESLGESHKFLTDIRAACWTTPGSNLAGLVLDMSAARAPLQAKLEESARRIAIQGTI